jgi:hypothetical protein
VRALGIAFALIALRGSHMLPETHAALVAERIAAVVARR